MILLYQEFVNKLESMQLTEGQMRLISPLEETKALQLTKLIADAGGINWYGHYLDLFLVGRAKRAVTFLPSCGWPGDR